MVVQGPLQRKRAVQAAAHVAGKDYRLAKINLLQIPGREDIPHPPPQCEVR